MTDFEEYSELLKTSGFLQQVQADFEAAGLDPGNAETVILLLTKKVIGIGMKNPETSVLLQAVSHRIAEFSLALVRKTWDANKDMILAEIGKPETLH